MFYKKVFLKISQNLQENTCTIDFVTGVFLWILWHFWECLFSKTQLGDCFWSLTLGRDYRTKRFDLILSTKNFSLTLLTKCRHIFFFYLGFLLRTFTNHRAAEEGGGYFFNSSLPLPPLHGRLGISRAIAAGSSPLRIASSRTQTGNLWFPSASR